MEFLMTLKLTAYQKLKKSIQHPLFCHIWVLASFFQGEK